MPKRLIPALALSIFLLVDNNPAATIGNLFDLIIRQLNHHLGILITVIVIVFIVTKILKIIPHR